MYVGCRLLIHSISVAVAAEGFDLESLDFFRSEHSYRIVFGQVFLVLRREEIAFLDHRCAYHRILNNQFLLCQIPEIFVQKHMDFFDSCVGVTINHLLIQQIPDVSRGYISDHLVTENRVDLVLGGAFEPIIGASLHGGEFEQFQPILHTLPKSFL